MTAMKLQEVPESLNEEYYQINLDIRNSFSKYRPPLNIFMFHEEVARIEPYYKVGDRLTNEQVEELEQLVTEGLAFVSRSDHPIYVKHISHQLDLVLVDKNLKPSEIADVFLHALTMRMEHFLEQPVKAVYERFLEDLLVLVEYLSEDPFRIKGLIKRLHKKHTLANHSVNCGLMGLALFLFQQSDDAGGQFPKRSVENLGKGLFLHDMGMAKIPAFIREKKTNLSPEEQQKLMAHPNLGAEMVHKLGLQGTDTEKCVLEHHERVNGSGYPNRIKDNETSYPGKLCAIIDSFCAMISERPYAAPKAPEDAVKELAADEKRYDGKISKFLQSLILTKKLVVVAREEVAAEAPAE